MSENVVSPSEGWGVVHLFLRARRGESAAAAMAAIDRFCASDPNYVRAFSVLGGRADIGFMCVSPDLNALDILVKELTSGPLQHLDSFVSVTELSEYISTEEMERERLETAGDTDIETKIAEWRERMVIYREHKLHPRMPMRKFICFYPMSKKRDVGANWFELPFPERRKLMGGHARSGKPHQPNILQLITGATGWDDWEWGVTLLSDDPLAVKQVVYEMRFDEASAKYAIFGPFWVGMMMEPGEVFLRCGLTL